MIIGWVDTDDLDNPDSPHAEDAARYATWILYKLTAEKYPGVSESTEWYGHNRVDCVGGICEEIIDFYELPTDVSSQRLRYLRLRHTPVISVESIEVGGSLMDPSEYKISNYSSLVRTDRSCWNLHEGVTITYSHGSDPPTAGRVAATHLADQLDLAMSGSDDCVLPERVSSVTRQGISYDILDPQQFITEGRTGIYQVDLFIHAANPKAATKKPKIFSTDTPRGERYR